MPFSDGSPSDDFNVHVLCFFGRIVEARSIHLWRFRISKMDSARGYRATSPSAYMMCSCMENDESQQPGHKIKDACNLDHASSSQIRKAEPLLTLILKTRESTTGCTACKSETARTDAQKISALSSMLRCVKAVCRFDGLDGGFIHNHASRLPVCLRNANVMLAHRRELMHAETVRSSCCALSGIHA